MLFGSPWTKFETYNPTDVRAVALLVKPFVWQQLWNMIANKIIATRPTDLNLTLTERAFKELSENVYVYCPLIYSC